ncbi:hypothetical protein EMCG_00016 [[Emmonsia] crescens]|uniref:Uncharacterized protein n=1 Tax=[Emmonsia] crescens TaxID=73230 RepID=A0A0G2IEL6_9EURO|nr:hypothetical protein EMCG_00016 [Emmonsia crescens UAMH 3008]
MYGYPIVLLGVNYNNITPEGRPSVHIASKGPTIKALSLPISYTCPTGHAAPGLPCGWLGHEDPQQDKSTYTAYAQSNFAGEIKQSNCDVNARDEQHSQWRLRNALDSTRNQIWFFRRDQIPEDIENGHSNHESWDAIPAVVFLKGIVDFGKRLVELKIAIDTTFCGDCAGDVWAITDGCAFTWHEL